MPQSSTTSPRFVRDLMTVGVETCSPNTPIAEVARRILTRTAEAVVVVDDGHALGVVGQEELVRAYGHEVSKTRVARDIMQEGITQIPPDIPLATAAQLMLDKGVRVMFLMHHAGGIEYPAAAISYWHILRHIAAENIEELNDLGIKAERISPVQNFIMKRDALKQKRIKNY